MRDLGADVLQTFRRLRRAPWVGVATVILLALGIGGVAALFRPLYEVVLAPLPYPDSDQLVRIGGDIPIFDTSVHGFEEPERLSLVFSHLTAYAPVIFPQRARFSSAGPSSHVQIAAVSPDFFETMGVAPRIGRSLAGEPASASIVVLSNHLWCTELGGAIDVVGRSIPFEGHPYVVVGVMPPGFDFPATTDLWAPMGAVLYDVLNIESIGRVRQGIPLRQAARRLKELGLKRGNWTRGRGGPVLQSLQAFLRGDRRPLLWILCTASTLFLLLACTGVANLLFAQSVRRRPQMAIHLVLGAGRWRLVRQLLAETLVLATGGGLVAMWLSTLAERWIAAQLPDLKEWVNCLCLTPFRSSWRCVWQSPPSVAWLRRCTSPPGIRICH